MNFSRSLKNIYSFMCMLYENDGIFMSATRGCVCSVPDISDCFNIVAEKNTE